MALVRKLFALFRGDYSEAGDRYYRQGKLAKAAAMYARAGRYPEAARLAADSGAEDQAVAYYLEADLPREAGELLAAAGRHKDAIPLFEKAGAHWLAAESSLALRQSARAGHYFEKAARFDRAAECYEKAGELEQALRLWQRESERLQGAGPATGSDVTRRRWVDLQRSRILARLGELEKSGRLLEELGEFEKAARVFERARLYELAAGAYLKANLPQRARELLERVVDETDPTTRASILAQTGDPVGAAEAWQELGRFGDAAEAFEDAGAWDRAAEAWRQAGHGGRAAEAFYKAERFEDAAQCYLDAEDYRSAAEAFEHVGSHLEAARCRVHLDEPLGAAEAFLKAGDRSSASDILQGIDADSPYFERGTLMLVPLLIEERLYEGALHRLRGLHEDRMSTPNLVEKLYWEGRTHDAQGELTEAERCYQKAVALRRDHRDLTARLISLRQRMARAGIDPGSGGSGAVRVPPALEAGTVLDSRYELLDELGRGGMSRVFRARDRALGGTVAIKILTRTADNLKSEERLQREVQILRQISHPNVVRVFDLGRWQGSLYVIMELLEGTTLDRVIQSKQRVEIADAKAIFHDILQGLQAAHSLKVIHRDLKPANVALTEGRAKIMDFGIALIEDSDVSLTQTGQVIGSPMYMSPEQIQGLPLDARTDLYSLGVLMFTLLGGREPFRGKTATAISLKHLQDAPPSLTQDRPDLDEKWEAFVRRLLAKRPEDRYPSARQVQAVLETLPD